MNIIVVGCGMVGYSLVEQLSSENHDIVVIDEDENRVRYITDEFDAMGVIGSGEDCKILVEAGIERTDLLIAVTDVDEKNLLCCIMAKRFENCRTIARVRNPVYSSETGFLRRELGLSMIINPEQIAANEIARIIQFPPEIKVDTFTRGRIELLSLQVAEGSFLEHATVRSIRARLNCNVLVCLVTRDDDAFIPDIDTEFLAGDNIVISALPTEANTFFLKSRIQPQRIKTVMIVGGGTTGYYLARRLTDIGIYTKIIESDTKRCEELSDMLPEAVIINGDGTDERLLLQEGISAMDAFAALTGLDEENVFLSLYAKNVSKCQTVTKINRINYTEVINKMDLDSVIFPRTLTADYIVKYARSMMNGVSSNVENIFRLENGKAEAFEFFVSEASAVTGVPIARLRLKNDLIICSITRNSQVIIPGGHDEIRVGDAVIVITTRSFFSDIKDIVNR